MSVCRATFIEACQLSMCVRVCGQDSHTVTVNRYLLTSPFEWFERS